MIIGGLQKFSLLDYPGKISAIVFTQGCNFRCGFCYNPMLVWPVSKAGELKNNLSEKQKGHAFIKEDDLFVFLEKRKNKLDAVVITGGEPTLWPDLPEFLTKIKKLGYLIKLDTNGTNPVMLTNLIKGKIVDYIAMDIKAPAEKYALVTGVKINFKNIAKSVKIIRQSGLLYEFRTTITPDLFDRNDIDKMGELVKGAEKWFLQKFKSDMDLVDNKLKSVKQLTTKEMEELAKIGTKYVKECKVR